MAKFRPDEISEFRLRGFDADASKGIALLRYSLDDRHKFEERVDFGRGASGAEGRLNGFRRVVRLLHLAAGVSYYKAAAPPVIVVEYELSDCELEFCRALYDLGMREFAYRNGLAIPLDFRIVVEPKEPGAHARTITPPGRVDPPEPGVAVPIGGGKDSVVVLEALRELDPVVVSVNPSEAVRRIASLAGSDLRTVKRTLDPRLFDLNEKGALNGHVPVTAIVSLITIAGGYLFGYDTTAMALEGSADSPSRVLVNEEVNHQWSKSAQFEELLQNLLRNSVHGSIRYVSPLRPFSELEVTRAFSTLPRYIDAFRSCNGTARLRGADDRWCCNCPKCRFVFLALATALDRKSVVRVFGSDLLDDAEQIPGFADMLDPERKPFECVGTIEEVNEAFHRLLDDPQWRGAAVLESLRQEVSGAAPSNAHGGDASAREVFDTVRSIVSGARRK